jgi:hypothetical protein
LQLIAKVMTGGGGGFVSSINGFDDVLAKSGLTDKGGLIGLMENPTRGIVHRELV